MSYTDNINGIPAQDTVLRQGIATLRNTVISNTIKPLTVDHNGVYTANPNNGTYGYSPVTVDTGVYTGATAPDNSIGKDGDYYYQLSNTYSALKDGTTFSSNSINKFIGIDFEPLVTLRPKILKSYNSNSATGKFIIRTLSDVIYDSGELTLESGLNSHIVTDEIELMPGTRYILAIEMSDTRGKYRSISSTTYSKYIGFKYGRYGTTDYGSSSTDSTDTYGVDMDFEIDVEHVTTEYIKDNDAWVTISSANAMVLSSLYATENRTYNAPAGTAYSSVTVDVGPHLPSGYTAIDYVECPSTGPAGFAISNYNLSWYDVVESLTMPYQVQNETAFAGTADYFELYFDQGKAKAWAGSSNKILDLLEEQNASANEQCYHRVMNYRTANLDFTVGYYRTDNYLFNGRIYYLKIYSTTNLSEGMHVMYYFIPCIQDATSKVGMYDVINDTFYSSTTGTEFVAPSNS